MGNYSLADDPHKSGWSKFKRLLTWSGVALCAIFAANLVADADRMQLPGAPVVLFWIGLGLAAVTAILLAPPVFRRLPQGGRAGGLIALVVLMIVAGEERQSAYEAYMRTTAGQKEQAAVNANAERAAEEKQRKQAAWEASPEGRAAAAKAQEEREAAQLASAKEASDKLERCFSGWGHRLSALEDPVKESMHNPGAFEHIETALTGTDVSGHNVVMRFRAENGFGALRSGEVSATLHTDCTVTDIGQPTVD